MKGDSAPDLTRITLMVLIIGVLIVGSLWTMLPFIGALIWATTIVVATWPLMLSVQKQVGGRRSIATAIMTIVMAVIFIVPFWAAVGTLFDASVQGVDVLRAFVTQGLGPPPEWVLKIPGVGKHIAERWQELAAGGPEAVTEAMRPYVRDAAGWVIAVTGGVGGAFLHFILTALIAGILYAKGDVAAAGVIAFARRLGRERGEHTVILAGQSIRSVALGVVVTALVQSALCGILFWLTGVPRPGLLLAITFVLCIAQIGPILVIAAAVAWLYWSGHPGAATILLILGIPVGIMDNFLRPILISRGVDLPMLLIIAGVIGGLIGFGVVGLFIGPVLLAVTFTLLESWIKDT